MSSLKTKYACEDARKDIDLAFSRDTDATEEESAFWRFLKHTVKGNLIKEHCIICRECWDYYLEKKRALIKEQQSGSVK